MEMIGVIFRQLETSLRETVTLYDNCVRGTNCATSKNHCHIAGLRYGVDGQGFEPRWGRDFPYPFGSAPEAHSVSSTKEIPDFFPGGKSAGAWP
jgi:hypothetical protein